MVMAPAALYEASKKAGELWYGVEEVPQEQLLPNHTASVVLAGFREHYPDAAIRVEDKQYTIIVQNPDGYGHMRYTFDNAGRRVN